VPEPFVAVASGRLTGTDDAGADPAGTARRTYHWVMDRPMANYLATVVTGRFEEQRLGEHGGVDYTNWLPADAGGEGGPFLGLDLVVDQLATVLGPYPFSTYGAVVYPASFVAGSARTKRFLAGVALETQGRSLYGEQAISEITVAHETAHQWMGDSVSLTDWSNDIWWVEGFAKYAETLDAADRGRTFAAEYAEVAPKWIPPAALPRALLLRVLHRGLDRVLRPRAGGGSGHLRPHPADLHQPLPLCERHHRRSRGGGERGQRP
jgi:hypothetical protein